MISRKLSKLGLKWAEQLDFTFIFIVDVGHRARLVDGICTRVRMSRINFPPRCAKWFAKMTPDWNVHADEDKSEAKRFKHGGEKLPPNVAHLLVPIKSMIRDQNRKQRLSILSQSYFAPKLNYDIFIVKESRLWKLFYICNISFYFQITNLRVKQSIFWLKFFLNHFVTF